MPTHTKLAFVASQAPDAVAAKARLEARYGVVEPAGAEVIVALGGDGLMLRTLHRFMDAGLPIYGMNRGSVGFLMNDYGEERLAERIGAAEIARVHPLRMAARDIAGTVHSELAINEVSLFRTTYQAAKLRISVDGKARLDELVCDGVLVATPAGSTAYNLSAHGPIVPINARLLALTPISPFRPRRWRGALLSQDAAIAIEVLEPSERLVSAAADHREVAGVVRVDIAIEELTTLQLMFDRDHGIDERILREQFAV
jgi:NAD+ kinase